MSSAIEQILDLSNPRPAEFHPDEEDWDLLSGAKLSQSRTYDDEGRFARRKGSASSRSGTKRRLLDSESDPRYSGRPTSRKQLYGSSPDNEEVELESEDDQSDREVESGDGQSNSVSGGDSEKGESSLLGSGDGGGEKDEQKPGEGEGKEEEEGNGFVALAMDKVQEELARAKSVREQIRLWDGLLEGRIKLHRALSLSNSLPQSSAMMTAFMSAGGDQASSSRLHVERELTTLLDSLLRLQQSLLLRHRDTRALAERDTHHPPGERRAEEERSHSVWDEEVPSDSVSDEEPKDSPAEEEEEEGASGGGSRQQRRRRRKRKCPWRGCGYEEYVSSVHDGFVDYREKTIAKWDTKLRLASGILTSKAFLQVDRSTVAQIKHVLEDKGRLVKRSQLKRSVYRVLGENEEPAAAESHDDHLMSHDPEIYDEDDFYHQLLRDLIERKMNYSESADPVAMGRQWLALQKMRSKVKKSVDTKASKGRKIRYNVHPKLVGFMAPVERGDMSHASRNHLFQSLFGAHSQEQ